MSSVTVPKGSIVCLMCRGAIPFENRGSYWFKKHLQKNHEIHFNYELYLAINLVNIESIKSVIRDFKQSGKLSEFTSREDDSKEVFDVEDDGATEEGTSMQVSYTSATHQMKEEEEDPKAKKDPKKAAAPVDEGEGTGNEIKILIDLANPNEEQRKLTFEMKVVY